MEQLHLPSSEAAHWIGVGTDAGHSTLTWLCMPFPGSLFAVEFSAASGAIRAGVMRVGVNDDDDGDASSDGEEAAEASQDCYHPVPSYRHGCADVTSPGMIKQP